MTAAEEKALYQIYISQTPYVDNEIDASRIGRMIVNTPLDDLVHMVIEHENELLPVTTNSIPQFSDIEAIHKVIRIIADSGIENISYKQLGHFLCPKGSTDGAKVKYGENHVKIAEQLGFVSLKPTIQITDLGMHYYLLPEEESKHLLNKLALRVPIIQRSLIAAQAGQLNLTQLMLQYIAPSTTERRRSNVNKLLKLMGKEESKFTKELLNNMYWEKVTKG